MDCAEDTDGGLSRKLILWVCQCATTFSAQRPALSCSFTARVSVNREEAITHFTELGALHGMWGVGSHSMVLHNNNAVITRTDQVTTAAACLAKVLFGTFNTNVQMSRYPVKLSKQYNVVVDHRNRDDIGLLFMLYAVMPIWSADRWTVPGIWRQHNLQYEGHNDDMLIAISMTNN